MSKPSLLIMAAGMASRFGSMKQIKGFGPSGESILDYSVYDAIEAGFGKVIFVIRKVFAQQFIDLVEPKFGHKIKIEYAYQELDAFLGDFILPAEREKPWGTGHAVLCAKDVVTEPFAVINADDFYGKQAFVQAYDFLTNYANQNTWGMLGYMLNNTLSDNGSVSRGVCQMNDNVLTSVIERTSILRKNGVMVYEENDMDVELAEDTLVSMNFWLFGANALEEMETLFHQFLSDKLTVPKSEFYIQNLVQYFIGNKTNTLKVLPTQSQWFGVTYKEDSDQVAAKVNKLVNDGVYPSKLF